MKPPTLSAIQAPVIAALRLAIEALTRERRRLHAAGEAAYNQGIRTDVIESDELTGVLFSFAEDGHRSYAEYTKAIQELEDLIEVLTDPGVTYDNHSDLPLFQTVKG